MDQRPLTLTSVLASAAVEAWTSLVNWLRVLIAIDVRTYQPEKYYMRGPGPKWREKYALGRVSALTLDISHYHDPQSRAWTGRSPCLHLSARTICPIMLPTMSTIASRQTAGTPVHKNSRAVHRQSSRSIYYESGSATLSLVKAKPDIAGISRRRYGEACVVSPDLARRAANRALQLRTALWEDRAFKKQESVVASGTVKWFNPTKGYGFIQPSSGGGKDVFVHISAVEKAGLSTLNDGQQVEYDLVANKGKESAENLKLK